MLTEGKLLYGLNVSLLKKIEPTPYNRGQSITIDTHIRRHLNEPS